MKYALRLTGRQHRALQEHLFPEDGCESVAVARCGRRSGEARHILTVRHLEIIPHDACIERTPHRVVWTTTPLEPLLAEAARRGEAVVKFHSHPGGLPHFSQTDDETDQELFASVYGWMDNEAPHASAVMLPGGRLFGRIIGPNGSFDALSLIAVAGDDMDFWFEDAADTELHADLPDFARKNAQLFGAGTTARLSRLSVAVVGCSGTGSPVIEQLARLGIGRLVLVDPDRLESKNQNRILNSMAEDVACMRYKVDVLAGAVSRMGLGTVVVPLARNVIDPEVVSAVADCDVVFGCMDGAEGRHLLGRLVTFYNLPYFDVGVKLLADGLGGINQVCGTVHSIQPGGSSLLSRGVYTMEEVRSEGLKRTDPEAYSHQLAQKYIVGAQEERPAVISVNMLAASQSVGEFLARLHPYRTDPNADFAVQRFSLTDGYLMHEPEGEPCVVLARHVGRGDVRPPLEMPALSSAGGV